VVKLAVDSGASLTLSNKAGMTPPQLADRHRTQSADLSPCDTKVWFDLSTACATGDLKRFKLLLCHTLAVRDRNKNAMTPLHVACR
jgi:ankyrin repeat protein